MPRPRAIESCPHCDPIMLPLLEGPVRDLPAGSLLQYGGKVLFTVGDVAGGSWDQRPDQAAQVLAGLGEWARDHG